jgi:hypothetical protein
VTEPRLALIVDRTTAWDLVKLAELGVKPFAAQGFDPRRGTWDVLQQLATFVSGDTPPRTKSPRECCKSVEQQPFEREVSTRVAAALIGVSEPHLSRLGLRSRMVQGRRGRPRAYDADDVERLAAERRKQQ